MMLVQMLLSVVVVLCGDDGDDDYCKVNVDIHYIKDDTSKKKKTHAVFLITGQRDLREGESRIRTRRRKKDRQRDQREGKSRIRARGRKIAGQREQREGERKIRARGRKRDRQVK